MARELRIDREQHLPADAAQVWQAVATGSGNRGWLYPMDIEPRIGGAVSRGPATVTVWEPPRRFACRYADDTGFSNTLSYRIDDRDDGTTVLHMGIHWVHEGVVDDGWDNRANAAERHAEFYHHTLDEYLRHFPGRHAHYVRATRPAASADGAGETARLRRALGLRDDASPGDAVLLAPDGFEPRDAVIDFIDGDFLGLRTAGGLYRFFGGGAWNWPTWLGHHLFTGESGDGTSDDAENERTEKMWSMWLEGLTL